jgi:hypothetical protein
MAKYRYRIDGGRYGGECSMGTVTEEFAKYWAPKIEEEGCHGSGFIDHVLSLSEWDDDDEQDPNSPNILDDGNEIDGWYAVDDKEHINAAFADGGFIVSSVPNDESDDYAYDEKEVSCEAHWLKGREGAYISTDSEGETPEGCTPVMIFMSVEKGGFATWFVDTDEPFEENKLVMSVNETHMGEFVEDVWYNKELLEADYDYNDTMGKSYEGAVGWSTDQWRDNYKDPEDEDLSEYWEEYDDEYES